MGKKNNDEAVSTPSTSSEHAAGDTQPSHPMNFDVYAQLKHLPQHHAAGMLAHTELRSATFEEWETAFKDY